MKPLDTTLRALAGYRLQRATGIAMLHFKDVFSAHGLRRTTFSCLSLIVETPGLRQSQIGKALAIERPNLVSVIEDLHNQGLISKTVCPTDRRVFELRATEKGRGLYQTALAAVQDLDNDLIDGLSKDEQDHLLSALQKIEQKAIARERNGSG